MATITSFKKKAKDCVVGQDNPFKPNRAGREQRMPDGYDPEKVEQLSDYRDKMIFDDVAENDIEMAKYAVKDAKRYYFKTEREAKAFVGKCLELTLNHCGVPLFVGMPAESLKRVSAEQKVYVEERIKDPSDITRQTPFYRGEDTWRNGLYIFKAGVLVAFISVPLVEQPSQFSINRKKRLFIKTNAKVAKKGFN